MLSAGSKDLFTFHSLVRSFIHSFWFLSLFSSSLFLPFLPRPRCLFSLYDLKNVALFRILNIFPRIPSTLPHPLRNPRNSETSIAVSLTWGRFGGVVSGNNSWRQFAFPCAFLFFRNFLRGGIGCNQLEFPLPPINEELEHSNSSIKCETKRN